MYLSKFSLLLLTLSLSFSCNANNNELNEKELKTKEIKMEAKRLYDKLDLKSSVSFNVFEKAFIIDEKVNKNKKNVFSVIDYSKKSDVKRFVIIDKKSEKLLKRTLVSHGQQSGYAYAKNFSNEISSHKTSLGVYKTAETYFGKYGYALKLDGLSSTNDNVRKRYVVLHGSNYSTQDFMEKNNNLLGRSLGCPAVPMNLSKEIIDLIKNGTYIYAFI